MMPNIVGIDKDHITLEEATALRDTILQQEHCQVLLWKTQHGFHLELVYTESVSKKRNFMLREKYHDCPERMRISRLRGDPYDVLFSIKDGHWRELIHDE